MKTKRQVEERRLFKRLVGSEGDLYQAIICAEQILKRDLHASTSDDDRDLLMCLNTALIVSYWRPFSGNESSPDEVGSLPASYLRAYTPAERKLHDFIGDSRNREHAHSDPKSRETRITVHQGVYSPIAIPISRNPFVPLSRDLVKQLQTMIWKLISKIVEAQYKIQQSFEIEEHF